MTTPTDTNLATVTPVGDREFRVERIFNAPRDLVWRAYTEADLVGQWWGRGHKLLVEALDVRPGGHWRFVEHTPEDLHGFEGRFREVTKPERIVMTFEWDGMPGHPSIDTAVFEDLGDGRTRLRVHSLFSTSEERDGMLASGMEGGMNESYQALDRLLATLR
ncbi:MAG: SRPBCC family protein [Hyphomicrobiales bacterium]